MCFCGGCYFEFAMFPPFNFRERAEYCFESTVSAERTHWVLRQTRWVLRQTRWVRVYTQIIGWEELTEFSPRNSVRAKKLTEFGVWNRTPRNHIRPVPKIWQIAAFWKILDSRRTRYLKIGRRSMGGSAKKRGGSHLFWKVPDCVPDPLGISLRAAQLLEEGKKPPLAHFRPY